MDGFLKKVEGLILLSGYLLASFVCLGSTNQKPKLAHPSTQIFRAETDNELDGLLQTAYLRYQNVLEKSGPENPCYLFIFVDIDEVIFANGTDYKVFKNGATYNGLKVLIPQTIQTINQFLDESNKISVLALTSSKLWRLDEERFPTKVRFAPVAMDINLQLENDIDDESYLFDYPCHRIRSGALDAAQLRYRPFFMPSLTLGLPYVALNPVLEDYSPTKEQENSIKPVSLVMESSTQSFNSLNLFKYDPENLKPIRRSRSRISNDPCLLAKSRPLIAQEQNSFSDHQEDDQNQQIPASYKRVVAYPFYSDGIIYSNFVNHDQEGWQKGRIMRAYLETVFGQDFPTWPPIFVIAIDDNDMMLTNMEDESRAIGIRFKGLWFKRKEPVFWLFVKPKEEKKQPPQDDFDSDLMRFPKVLGNADDE